MARTIEPPTDLQAAHGFMASATLSRGASFVRFTLRNGDAVVLTPDEADHLAMLLGEAANACRDYEDQTP